MDVVALVLYVVALLVMFGLRSWLQLRRTGSAGFRGISGAPGTLAWWGGVLFILAIATGLAAPVLATAGVVVPAGDALWLSITGLVVALAGFAAVLAGQSGMGSSWRIGVDEGERTDLVTSGIFAVARNPVFTAMVIAQLGMVLLVPTWLSALALAALVAAVQIQVRVIEEPYLRRLHGVAYEAYAARVGRFVPGLGHLAGHSKGVSP